MLLCLLYVISILPDIHKLINIPLIPIGPGRLFHINNYSSLRDSRYLVCKASHVALGSSFFAKASNAPLGQLPHSNRCGGHLKS